MKSLGKYSECGPLLFGGSTGIQVILGNYKSHLFCQTMEDTESVF